MILSSLEPRQVMRFRWCSLDIVYSSGQTVLKVMSRYTRIPSEMNKSNLDVDDCGS